MKVVTEDVDDEDRGTVIFPKKQAEAPVEQQDKNEEKPAPKKPVA